MYAQVFGHMVRPARHGRRGTVAWQQPCLVDMPLLSSVLDWQQGLAGIVLQTLVALRAGSRWGASPAGHLSLHAVARALPLQPLQQAQSQQAQD